jgi:hypothetical protein
MPSCRVLRLNSSCSRSIAFVVRTLRHWLGGSRVKVKIYRILQLRRNGHSARRCEN